MRNQKKCELQAIPEPKFAPKFMYCVSRRFCCFNQTYKKYIHIIFEIFEQFERIKNNICRYNLSCFHIEAIFLSLNVEVSEGKQKNSYFVCNQFTHKEYI